MQNTDGYGTATIPIDLTGGIAIVASKKVNGILYQESSSVQIHCGETRPVYIQVSAQSGRPGNNERPGNDEDIFPWG